MERSWTHTLSDALDMPFCDPAVARDAEVDPLLFSEEAFPVHCPGCGYLLRGLPDGRCPECGRPFKRGQLLVRQYVHEPIQLPWRRRQLLIALAAEFVILVTGITLFLATRSAPAANLIQHFQTLVLLPYALLAGLWIVSGAIIHHTIRRHQQLRQKREQVREAVLLAAAMERESREPGASHTLGLTSSREGSSTDHTDAHKCNLGSVQDR